MLSHVTFALDDVPMTEELLRRLRESGGL